MDNLQLQQRMRFQPTGMKIREGENGEESRTIEGCAIVYNRETTIWDGKYYRLREIIAPSCITEEFLREQDIKLNLLHDRESTVARNNKGEGTLILEPREDGLYFKAEMPKCDLGDRALELVRNKTYTGCSFEFYAEEYTEHVTTLPDGREDNLITHTKFKSVTALTIAMDPAYEDTSVGVREQMEKREVNHSADLDDKKKAEEQQAREAKQAREASERERDLFLLTLEHNN